MIRYKIRNWARHNTVLEYNAPCQKDTGFFFLPVSIVTDLIRSDRCSEMDIMLDLWVSAIYNDSQVQGSVLGPVAYFRNGTGNPLVTYTELAARWGLSRATVGRILKKLSGQNLRASMALPSRIFRILSTWPAPIRRAAILSITPSTLSPATKC